MPREIGADHTHVRATATLEHQHATIVAVAEQQQGRSEPRQAALELAELDLDRLELEPQLASVVLEPAAELIAGRSRVVGRLGRLGASDRVALVGHRRERGQHRAESIDRPANPLDHRGPSCSCTRPTRICRRRQSARPHSC